MRSEYNPTPPYWSTSSTFPPCEPLAAGTDADVVVVGGGVSGLTTAYLLATAGKRVVLLERHRCLGADTGHTSAHLTTVTDTRLHDLVGRAGRDHAQAVWDAGLAAIAQIDATVREHEIDGGFAWVDGYLHAPALEPDDDTGGDDGVKGLEDDAALARDLGFDAVFMQAVPVFARPGVRFDGQARVHPGKYLAGVAAAVIALGGRIHEHSAAEEFLEDPRAVKANGHLVRCEDIVFATHNPAGGFSGETEASFFQTKLALYTSYVVAGRAPRDTVPDALWWDTGSPYRFLRVEPHHHHDLVIFGGEDHKTGQQNDTDACYRRLENRLVSLLPGVDLTHRWSGQVIETPDGLPYIGRGTEHQYLATGFGGNGLTFGTLAGMMIADAILKRPNPWVELFDPHRQMLASGVWEYLKENVDYPYYKIRDRFAGVESRPLRAVKRGQGQVIERHGEKVAAYRDLAGEVTLRSAACTHMGCAVTWNGAERTWDCPCHGSRFRTDGEVIAGPAQSGLPPV